MEDPFFSTFSACTTTLTYSFWLKLMKSEIGIQSNIFRSWSANSRPGIRFESLSTAGFYSTIIVSKYKMWEHSTLGQQVNKTKWNHFTFTVDDNKMSCVFINGRRDQCDTSPSSVNFGMHYNTRFRIGGDFYSNKKPGMYLDDFAIWLTVLTDEEVYSLYVQSRD